MYLILCLQFHFQMNEMISWFVGLLEMCLDVGSKIGCKFWDVLGNIYFISKFAGICIGQAHKMPMQMIILSNSLCPFSHAKPTRMRYILHICES